MRTKTELVWESLDLGIKWFCGGVERKRQVRRLIYVVDIHGCAGGTGSGFVVGSSDGKRTRSLSNLQTLDT